MRKLILVITFLWVACSATQPSCPTCPPPVVTTDTVHVPGPTVYVHDTTTIAHLQIDTIFTAVNLDTPKPFYVMPVPGDNYPQLQAAINYCLDHGIADLYLAAGAYPISHVLIIADSTGGRFHAVTLHIHGACWAKNAVEGYLTEIDAPNVNEPAFIAQECKGCIFENLWGQGYYDFPDTLTQYQIDTLSFAGWSDGRTRDNPTSPYAFIVFDPFSDSTAFTGKFQMYPGLHSWYLNSGGSGSTACKVRGCLIENFKVGVLITGGNNYNGELIDVGDNQFDNDQVCYGCSQAQSKANTFNNNMIWGQCMIGVDGNHFGFPHGNAATMPFINILNIAGFNRELFECDTRSFSFNAYNIYGEGLYMLGITGAATSRGDGANFFGWQVDLQNDAPSPPFVYQGAGTTWTGCSIRYYNDGVGPRRMVFNDIGDLFIGGDMSGPPIVVQGQASYEGGIGVPVTTLLNTGMFYDYTLGASLSGSGWDSVTGGYLALVRVNPATATGYYLTSDTAGLVPYMPILTEMIEPVDSASNYHPSTAILNPQTVLGYVTRVGGDTVFLSNMGQGIHDSTVCSIFPARLKKQ